MARVPTNISESVYQIKQWKGVNEAQEGEASLEMGEAAVMRNFKVRAARCKSAAARSTWRACSTATP